MPFASEKQRRYMHKNLPDIAQKWEKEMGHSKKMVGKMHKTSAKAAAKRMGF